MKKINLAAEIQERNGNKKETITGGSKREVFKFNDHTEALRKRKSGAEN